MAETGGAEYRGNMIYEVGNMIYNDLVFMAEADTTGVVVGAGY
jgi:hypothetical protein